MPNILNLVASIQYYLVAKSSVGIATTSKEKPEKEHTDRSIDVLFELTDGNTKYVSCGANNQNRTNGRSEKRDCLCCRITYLSPFSLLPMLLLPQLLRKSVRTFNKNYWFHPLLYLQLSSWISRKEKRIVGYFCGNEMPL